MEESLPSSLYLLSERSASNARRIEQLQAQIDTLKDENTRIASTLATLQDFGIWKPTENFDGIVPQALNMPEMITTLIKEHGPLTPKDFITLIPQRWPVEASGNHVRPTLWRLANTNRLRKKGDRYDLP